MCRKNLMLIVLAITATLAIVACGDDDGGGSSEDEDQITEAIEFAATSGDPAACTKVQTPRFNQQTSGEPGQSQSAAAATKQCEENAADTPAEEIEVSDIEVDGDTATATGAITGSFFDGQTLNVSLVKEDDQWKLDEIPGFAEFDRGAFETALNEQLAADPEGATPEQIDCVNTNLGKLSDEELQAFFLGQSDAPSEEAIFGPCFQGE